MFVMSTERARAQLSLDGFLLVVVSLYYSSYSYPSSYYYYYYVIGCLCLVHSYLHLIEKNSNYCYLPRSLK